MKKILGEIFKGEHLLSFSIIFILALPAYSCCSPGNETGMYYFSGAPSRETLEAYLSRAITMSDLFQDDNETLDMNMPEAIRMITNIGAKFLGRVVFIYTNEQRILNVLDWTRKHCSEIHNADPEIVIQAAIFEIITPSVENVSIPGWVFAAFGMAEESRNFIYDDMLFDADGDFPNNINAFGEGLSVPDITKRETQLWHYYLAASYIDAGIEAIHLGIFEWVTEADGNKQETEKLLTLIRNYAGTHARRKWIFLDAHTHGELFKRSDNLLLDFHSAPLIPHDGDGEELPGDEGIGGVILKMGYLNSIYGRSAGGTAPAGWSCDSLPYLAEFDHGYSYGSIEANTEDNFVLGYDEITWFAETLSKTERDAFLRYADNWIKENDANGHLQMPGLRSIWVNFEGHDEDFYYANSSDSFHKGSDQEAVIKEIWNDQ